MSDVAAIKAALAAQEIETPSWAYGNSGTRFKVFAQPGVPRTVKEQVDDAATVRHFTGVAPSVALLPPYPGVCAPELPANRQQQGLTTQHAAPCHFEAICLLSSVDMR